jgi:hypothetical protein
MNHTKKHVKLPISLLSVILAGLLLAGCAQTVAPSPSIFQRAQGKTPAPPPPSGFFGNDYSLLTPPAEGSGQQAMLQYTNTDINWGSYNAIIIAPVTFWGTDDSKVSAADQQILCTYFDKALLNELGKNFAIADQPGPGVAKLSVALTDATSAIPVLRTISLVWPQGRVLSLIKLATTGTYPFVGSAQGEAKLTDSVSGQLLEAWADRRMGGASLKNVNVFWWGDAENAMDYWANGLGQGLVTLRTQPTASTVAAN